MHKMHNKNAKIIYSKVSSHLFYFFLLASIVSPNPKKEIIENLNSFPLLFEKKVWGESGIYFIHTNLFYFFDNDKKFGFWPTRWQKMEREISKNKVISFRRNWSPILVGNQAKRLNIYFHVVESEIKVFLHEVQTKDFNSLNK